MNLVILDAATLDLDHDEWSLTCEFGDVTLYDHTPYDPQEIVNRCYEADIVLTNKVPIGQEVIDACPNLKLISVLATGYNIIDCTYARQKGVVVCNVPAYSTNSVAQHTLALILELCHNVGLHSDSVHAGEWVDAPEFCYWKKPLIELDALKVGLVGFGAIGRRVGELLNAFGASVYAYARRQKNAPRYEPFQWASLEDIFAKCDIVSLHCPMTDETAGFVNAEWLASMKPSAFLINTSRGGLINEYDLADALHNGRIAGAGLDVVDMEPMREDCPLIGAPNCMITPHMAWSSLPSRQRLIRITAANIRSFINSTTLNVVN